MSIDAPARLAILGGGPVGLEAALYARFLGYDVVLYEQGEVGQAVRKWGEKPLSEPFGQRHSTLGLAAIEAQDETYRPPSDETVLTGNQWLEWYLAPLATTDLIAEHLRLHTAVVGVSKVEAAASDASPEDEDSPPSLIVFSRQCAGEEQSAAFHGILDCTGTEATGFWVDLEDQVASGFYVLGSKSGCRSDNFPFQHGLNQIRDLFADLGDRATLDLYAGAKRLLR